MQKNIPHIYHGVDLELFGKEFTPETVDTTRRIASNNVITGNSFVIGWVGRDQYRKQVWKLWELMHYLVHGDYITCNNCGKVTLMEFDKMMGCPRAIGLLRMYDADYNYQTCWHCNSSDIAKGIPNDDIFAWSHMSPAQGDGWDPNQLGDIWRVRPKVYSTSGLTPNRGIKTEEMPQVYRMFDVFYCMSGGEGFGIPVLESMATGIPVAFTNYSAHAEVVGDTGIPINCQWTCEMNSCYDRASADTADAIAKLLPFIKDKSKLAPLKEKARTRAQRFSWDNAAKKLLGLIDVIADKIKHGHGKVI
jgi:glycosyltransferase involved in cell wall biosynthesis